MLSALGTLGVIVYGSVLKLQADFHKYEVRIVVVQQACVCVYKKNVGVRTSGSKLAQESSS